MSADTAACPGFVTLADRVDAFRAAAGRVGSPEHALIERLRRGNETDDQVLNRIGLPSIR